MKITDYAPRSAPFDTYLAGSRLAGAEIGVDAGAHAHALLLHCGIDKLYLVDIWEKDYYYGYAQGRLHTHGYLHRAEFMRMESVAAARRFRPGQLDFVYLDQLHDYNSVRLDLETWWPLLAPAGIMGLRNYAPVNAALVKAADEFAARNHIRVAKETAELIMFRQ